MSSRVIVFGYGRPALVGLETFAAMSIAPVAVVTPGNRTGDAVDMVAREAARRGLPRLEQPPRSRLDPFLAEVRLLRPDFLFVWSYSMLLPPSLVSLAPRGAINLHAGALPAYRGGHVLNWAIINGERETAATLHMIDDGIDTGPVFAERRVPIGDADDVATVHERLMIAGASLLRDWWPRIERGEAAAVPQDESRAHYYPMRTPADGRVDWQQTNRQIHNLVRALASPWPGAFTDVNGTRIVWRRMTPIDWAQPSRAGAVLRFADEAVIIGTGAGAVRVDAAEINGAPAGVAELRQAGLNEGTIL